MGMEVVTITLPTHVLVSRKHKIRQFLEKTQEDLQRSSFSWLSSSSCVFVCSGIILLLLPETRRVLGGSWQLYSHSFSLRVSGHSLGERGKALSPFSSSGKNNRWVYLERSPERDSGVGGPRLKEYIFQGCQTHVS